MSNEHGEGSNDHSERLEYLRGELRAERFSYGEVAELQSLAAYIEPGDVELLEAAGVPEFPEDHQLSATIEATGRSLADLLDALDEARRRIADEYTSGMDRNDDSGFTFTVTPR